MMVIKKAKELTLGDCIIINDNVHVLINKNFFSNNINYDVGYLFKNTLTNSDLMFLKIKNSDILNVLFKINNKNEVVAYE